MQSSLGSGCIREEIASGVRIDHRDLCSTHEEADILITQHAISLSLLGKSVHVVCDDTDVFYFSYTSTIVNAKVSMLLL